MSHGTRLLIGVAVAMFVVLIIGVPFSLYEQNQSAIRRNSQLIERLAADEATTQKLVARLADDEAQLAANTAAQRRSTCLSGNDYRQGDADLWHYLITSFSTPNPSAEEMRRTAQFLAYLAVHDKQRDCSKL